MILSQQTINALSAQGINVRWYPEETYEEFKKNQWDKQYQKWFNYNKSCCKELNPTGEWVYKWDYETKAEYEEHIRKFCDQIINRHCDPYEYNTLYVEHDGGQIFAKKENVKSKQITEDYVLKLVEKDRKVYAGTYGKFAMCMQKLCKERGYNNNLLVYPTTYGIGVWVFYNFHAAEYIEDVTRLMDELGIEYYNEYSDKHWVYRFKISKKQSNLQKIM